MHRRRTASSDAGRRRQSYPELGVPHHGGPRAGSPAATKKMHRSACTKLAKPSLLAPVMTRTASVVDSDDVSVSHALASSSSPASEGGTGAGVSSDSTAVRVKSSVVLPNS